jgi:DNA-binding GntR family transcriptional regulator
MSGRDLSEILSPPEKRSLADEVTASIREAILGGRLSPGERLREESLAKTLNVSRGPVRAAILQLQREGLVVVRRNFGTFVAHLSQNDLDEVYSLRLAIERLAVQLATRGAETERIAPIQAVVDRMMAQSSEKITERDAAELDLQFHESIYLATDHRRLIDVWSSLRPQIHILLLTRNVVNSDFREGLVKGHQQILDAILDHDEALSVGLIEAHLKASYERVSRSYALHASQREPAPV